MTDPEEVPFFDRLEAAAAQAAVRERQSARFLTLCLLATLACMVAWAMQTGFGWWQSRVFDRQLAIGFDAGISFEIGLDWWTSLLPWAVVLCYGVLGAAALLHFAVFRRRAQQLRRQRSQALLIELEEALARRAALRPGK